MALIGEQFDESDENCGVVASVRQKEDKISLWTKTAANEAAQVVLFYVMVRNLTISFNLLSWGLII